MHAPRVARHARHRTTVATVGGAWLTLAFAAAGCRQSRPVSAAPPPIATDERTLHVTTGALATGVAHRYVLRSARVGTDSVVGMVVEESQTNGTGGWGAVVREAGTRRVAVATADIVEMSRSEPSPNRTAFIVVGVLLGLVSAVLILLSIGAKDY